MAIKNFKTRNGIDVDTYTLPNTVIQATVKTNSITTIDTIPMDSFISAEYLITITQGSKIRTSKVVMHEDGTSVDMTEYGITETGGTISGVVISATTSSTNAILQATITDAATTIARIKMSRNLNVIFTPVAPDAPTIGTATGGVEQASITFTEPYDNGGASITTYTAISSPGSITGTSSTSPITVTGLVGGGSYTFTVTATNSAGTSAASSASNSVTPTLSTQGGYIAGGTSGGTVSNVTEKLLFANDSRSTLSPTLAQGRRGMAGVSNSSMAGYFAGGYTLTGAASNTTQIDKITFSNESFSVLTGTLGTARSGTVGASNSGTAGYIVGGTATNFTQLNSVEKLQFSNESRSTLSATLSQVFRWGTGFANSGTAGYAQGGGASGGDANRVYKITFSNDTISLFTIPQYRAHSSGFANSGTAGYTTSGDNDNGTLTANINKILFSNDSTSTITTTLNNRSMSSGFAKSGTAGYIAGGASSWGGQGSDLSSVNKLVFSTDTTTSGVSTLATARIGLTGLANSGVL